MKISMESSFQILRNNMPLTKENITSVSIGGYYFIIDGKEIPFDWDAFCGDEENGIFSFETGYGFMFDDFELSDCYNDDYAEIGLVRESITAEFLSSAESILEFHINFIDEYDEECDIGNNAYNELFKIKLLNIIFIDLETGNEYSIDQEVIAEYNCR